MTNWASSVAIFKTGKPLPVSLPFLDRNLVAVLAQSIGKVGRRLAQQRSGQQQGE